MTEKTTFTSYISKSVSKERGEYLTALLEDACNFLVGYFPDKHPGNLRINILDEQDWKSRVGEHVDYGMAYAEKENVMLAATPSAVTDGFVMGVLLLSPIQYFSVFKPTYYNPEIRKPDLLPFIDFLAVHELAHVFAEVNDVQFPRYWLDEVFADILMHAFTMEHRAAYVEKLEVLPEVIEKSKLFRLLSKYKMLQDYDPHYIGKSDQPMSNMNYGWYELRFYHLAVRLLKASDKSVANRMLEFGKKYCRENLGDISHNALVDLLRKEVCPEFATLLINW